MKFRLSRQNVPFYATVGVCVLLFAAGCVLYENFATARNVLSFFVGKPFLGILAIGMTFVIISGGIDLSVGAMIGCTSVLLAVLMRDAGLDPYVAMGCTLVFGVLLGGAMGALIGLYDLPPFLVTLGGMFFCRGLGLLISGEMTVGVAHPAFLRLSEWAIPLSSRLGVPLPVCVFGAMFLAGLYVSRYTRFGRAVYAVGGSEPSALLMGLPVTGTKIGVYALSGFCSAMGGIMYTIGNPAGDPQAGKAMELDAIAAVVVGGTLLSGGVGFVTGTLFGYVIFQVIQTALVFQSAEDGFGWLGKAGWPQVAVGALLFVFIVLQRLIQRKGLQA